MSENITELSPHTKKRELVSFAVAQENEYGLIGLCVTDASDVAGKGLNLNALMTRYQADLRTSKLIDRMWFKRTPLVQYIYSSVMGML